ncbi:uncharacterized protein VB005_00566 [Metarhizium brunneum]
MPDSWSKERAIYIGLRHIFTGSFATLRDRKSVKKAIKRHQKEQNVLILLGQYDMACLTAATLNLLEKGIFESAEVAASHFRHLPYFTRDVGVQTQDENEEVSYAESKTAVTGVKGSLLKAGGINTKTSLHFSICTQNQLLEEINKLIQLMVFDLGRRYMPEVMQLQQWNEPHLVNLDEWEEAFRFRAGRSKTASALAQINFGSTLTRLNKAVRACSPLSIQTINKHVTEAESLAQAMGDAVRSSVLCKIRKSIQLIAEEYTRNEEAVFATFSNTIISIGAKRAELDRMEATVLENLEKETIQHRQMATHKLGNILQVTCNES